MVTGTHVMRVGIAAIMQEGHQDVCMTRGSLFLTTAAFNSGEGRHRKLAGNLSMMIIMMMMIVMDVYMRAIPAVR